MRKIKKENIKEGEFIYIISKEDKRERAFVVNIIKLGKKVKIKYYKLKEKSKDLFELEDNYKRNTHVFSKTWDYYNLFKLNKRETLKLNRHLIISNLE